MTATIWDLDSTSRTTYGFRVTGVTAPSPELQQVLKTVPYRNGSYDFTYAYDGAGHYGDCEFTVTFKRPPGGDTMNQAAKAIADFRDWLYGIRCTTGSDGVMCRYISASNMRWVSCTKVESELSAGGMAAVTATFNCTEPAQFTTGG